MLENIQTGGGKEEDLSSEQNILSADTDKALLHSMKHPKYIKTGSILLGMSKPIKHKLEVKDSNSTQKKAKMLSSLPKSMPHKFKFM